MNACVRLVHPQLENPIMSRSISVPVLLTCLLLAAALTGCSRDPNVRKQKYLDSGDKYFAEGKYREAEIQYSNAIQIDPRFAQAHYQLSQSYLKLGDLQRAYQELRSTVEIAPNNYAARLAMANLLISNRELKEARVQLEFLRQNQPDTPETLQAWANLDAAQGDLSSAMQEMQKGIDLDRNRSESYLNMALIQSQAGVLDQAEANFKKAAALAPKAMNVQLLLGRFYEASHRLPEAEQQFKNAIAVDPRDSTPRTDLVQLLIIENKKDEAESFLRQTKKDLSDNPEGYRMLGDYYFATGDKDKALTEYASLHSDHPKDIRVQKNYIQLLILKKRFDEATKLNDEILKANANDVDALIYRGQVQLSKNDAAGAIDSLHNALRNDPDNANGHYWLGNAFAQQNNLTQSESEWREAVRLRPDLADAQRALAGLELSRGDIDSLLQTAQQIITAQPNAADGFIFKGIADLSLQKYGDAQQDAEQAAQRAPQNPAPYVQMGNIQLIQKHYPEAEKFYQQALDKDPSSAEGLSGLMNTYFVEKQYDKAIAAANAQIAKSPNNASFYDLLGTALFNSRKDLPAAEAALLKAIELDKNNIDALEKLAKVQIAEGSSDKALATYQQSIKDNPREVTFYILSGELYEDRKDWDQAKAMYQQALSISPEQPAASNNLAYLMLEHGGNVDVAMGLAQTARRKMQDSPDAADTLGWAYYHKGVYQSAIEQFQEALRLREKHGSPDDANLHYHLGLAYQKNKQTAPALQQLEKAVKLNPKNDDARKALSELRG